MLTHMSMTSANLTKAAVLSRQDVCSGIFRLDLNAPDVAAAARPGQFIMVKIGLDLDPLLRRPISIHDCVDGRISLLIRVVGRGTDRLSRVQRGDELDILGPLGHGFTLKPGPTMIVAGGMGMAPFAFVVREALKIKGCELRFHLGGRTLNDLRLAAAIFDLGIDSQVCRLFTEDGSEGRPGLVTEGLAEELTAAPADVLACGPEPMLKAVAEICRRVGVDCQASLERRMACGLGACLGCVVDAPDGGRVRVCLEGPVFPSSAVVL